MSTEFCMKFADHVIGVNAACADTRRLFSDWLTDEQPDITLSFTPEDIAGWRKIVSSKKERTDAQIEHLMIYHYLGHIWPDHDILQIHSAVVALNGEAYMFSATMNTGKSTHARLWREQLGAVSVNDDMPLVSFREDGIYVCSQPFNHASMQALSIPNYNVPLKAICFIYQDSTNHIEPFTIEKAYPAFMFRIYPMWVSKKIRRKFDEEPLYDKTFPLVDRLLGSVKMYSMGCTPDPEAAYVAYNGMNEQ